MQLKALLERGIYPVLLVIFGCVIHVDGVRSTLHVQDRCPARNLDQR